MSTRKAFVSRRVFLENEIIPACIIVDSGKVTSIQPGDGSKISKSDVSEIINVGDQLIMPGVVDCHVHVNEPGRTAWEGYLTATKAAAAGGVTTIVDMPLNSIPSTVTLPAFTTKLSEAAGKCYVDVGFWGGIVPGNQNELVPMLNAGVMGFKCFLIHSGVDEFPHVDRSDLEQAFPILQGTSAVVLFHAEVDCGCGSSTYIEKEPRKYETFLESRPDQMELEAIKLVCELCLKYRVRCHIVHLSTAKALPIIIEARKAGAPLTVETCHHYLSLEAETIPDGATQYKCCPPIRGKSNQDLLWEALKDGHIDMVVSDHSPCTADLKVLDTGDFLCAWGGIASVQLGLSLFWTNCLRHDMTLVDLVQLLCRKTAEMANLGHRKGAIKEGYDADFVIWDPDSTFKVTEKNIHFKNKITPYMGKELKGVVQSTIVQGVTVYDRGEFSEAPRGHFMLNEKNKSQSAL
ncbi:allB [Mytilus coruscus]|uniref:allantoinase n=1 Tax=Mytilus coruscus TaxID=42192 RepID=A0A6J8BTQ5_MYTCO|nr:allB [Mytilus coruscus]